MHTFHHQRLIPTTPAAVFDAFRDPTRLARWWGPAGFSNRFETFEFEVGGQWVFDMIGPDGTVYPNASTFTQIEPDRQVTVRHVCAPFFALSVTLEAAPGGTLVRWAQTFDDAAVAAAIAHIVEPANEQNLERLAAELG